MKKLLPLLFLSSLLSAQPVKLFHENFDAPSGPDSVTTNALLFNAAGTLATQLWNDTSFLSTSGNTSYHVSGTLHNDISFTTNSFSTVGKPFVSLRFNHIAKLYLANQARIQISTDGGSNWTILEDDAYEGQSSLFQSNYYFNEGAYQITDIWQMNQNATPQQSWWVQEVFDLRGYAYDTIAQTGYPNVMLRFTARFILGTPGSIPSNQIFRAGWFVDDVEVIGSSCEHIPPQVSFDSTGTCQLKPEGSIITQPSGIVPVSVIATDQGTGMDRVELIYTKNNVIDTLIMNLINPSTGEYTVNIPNIGLGDTVNYYPEAYDMSCPNVTRLPQAFQTDIMFYVEKNFPVKCGSPFCGQAPPTIDVDNLPWLEDFEGPEWVAGNNGTSTGGSSYRGIFPTFPNGSWSVVPPVNQTHKYAWSIADGPTGTVSTGPPSNHTPGGSKYLYTEGSYSSPVGSNNFSATRLITPCINLQNNTKDLAFELYYHMYGEDIGSTGKISIDIDTASGNEPSDFHNAFRLVIGEQQNSPHDPWKRLAFSLEPFNGQIIRISVVGYKYGTGVRYDMAIDDMSIYEVSPIDAALNDRPLLSSSTCSYSQPQNVSISIRNEGADTLYSIPVAMQLDNGIIVYDTATGSIGFGDSLTFTFTQTVTLTMGNIYQLKAWVNLNGDLQHQNDTVYSDPIQPISSMNSPLFVDFEQAVPATDLSGTGTISHPNIELNFKDNSQFGGAKWVVYNKKIRDVNNGPLWGDQRGGNYLIFKDDNTGFIPDEAQMKLNCIDFSGMTNPYLSFKVHNFQTNKLEVRIRESNSSVWTTLPDNYGTRAKKDDDYVTVKYNLDAYAGEMVNIMFVGHNSSPGTSGFLEYLAIDDIHIHNRAPVDIYLAGISSPFYNVPQGSPLLNQIDLNLVNAGMTSSANGVIKIVLTDTCVSPAQVITGQSTNMTINVLPLNQTTRTTYMTYSAPINAGSYEVKIWMEVANDNNPHNDTLRRTLNILKTEVIPYYNDFDGCYKDILIGGDLYEWEVAAPSKGPGWNTSFSGQKVAITNASENLVNSDEIMRFPTFIGFDSIYDAELRFWHQYEFTGNGFGTVQYFNQGQWEVLPHNNKAQNWLQQFTGSSGWIQSTYPLNMFNQTSRQLFLRFLTSNNSNQKGWMVDNFEIYVPPQNSASPQSAHFSSGMPTQNSSNSLEIQLANTGAAPLSQAVVKVEANGSVIGTDTVLLSPPLSPGRSRMINITHPIVINTYGSYDLKIITSFPNDRIDNLPTDDTLSVTAHIPAPVDSFPYCNDFESAASFSNFNSISNFYDSDWIYGTPSKMYFSSARSGSNAWFTSENDYSPLSQQVIATPDIEVLAGQCYSLSFWHMFDTELNFDGGTVEYSLDSGQTWWQLGSVQDTSWFNTPAIHALSAYKSGWSGQSDFWEKAQKLVRFYEDATVRFRFIFASGSTNHGEGWMIDDFCFEESNGNCDFVHINNLYQSGKIQLYPNPATESIKFTSSLHHLKRAYVSDVHGKLVMEIDISILNGANGIIQISSLPKGMYFLHLESQKERVNSKFLKH